MHISYHRHEIASKSCQCVSPIATIFRKNRNHVTLNQCPKQLIFLLLITVYKSLKSLLSREKKEYHGIANNNSFYGLNFLL